MPSQPTNLDQWHRAGMRVAQTLEMRRRVKGDVRSIQFDSGRLPSSIVRPTTNDGGGGGPFPTPTPSGGTPRPVTFGGDSNPQQTFFGHYPRFTPAPDIAGTPGKVRPLPELGFSEPKKFKRPFRPVVVKRPNYSPAAWKYVPIKSNVMATTAQTVGYSNGVSFFPIGGGSFGWM